jgi:F-type H+-transporting ATPase subunit gamma
LSNLKAIRRRIASVKSTKQITRAMKLVATAKLRRAQEAALGGRAFSEKLGRVLATVCSDLPADYVHPLLQVREQVQKRRIIAVAGERGLCGAFNVNVFKEIQAQELNRGAQLEFVPVGKKMVYITKQRLGPVVEEYQDLGEDISRWPLAAIAKQVMDDYIAGKCDEVVLYYTKFQSIVTQHVTREVILPINLAGAEGGKDEIIPGMTKYDPSPTEIFAYLLPMLAVTKLRQAALDSKASEHAARMRAMDSATRNADELIDKLRLRYNRERQRAITVELIDIVGGAEALK